MALADDILRTRLFEGLSALVAESLPATAPRRELAAGEHLLRAGDRNDQLFLVLAGSVDVRVAGADGPYIRLGSGECVAELSVLDRLDVTADVVASEPTIVLGIDHDTLWSMVDAHAGLARNLLRILAGRVRHDDAAFARSMQAQRAYERMANVDGLTGVRNRRWLDVAFARQLAQATREAHPTSLLMIDLDHFKQLNDRHGHLIGDDVLCLTARRLAAHVRPQDLLARYGGEEFVVMLPETATADAIAVAERLRLAVAATDPAPQQPLPAATVSIGVASVQGSSSIQALVAAADAALYRAKRAGRNRVSE
jgi:diguanylate cyclase (GGDEF)-like protein